MQAQGQQVCEQNWSTTRDERRETDGAAACDASSGRRCLAIATPYVVFARTAP
jgi:hypothetical protein